MGYEAIEMRAKSIVESVEQGECFYVGRKFNSVMADLESLKADIQKHWDSFTKEDSNE